MKYFFIALSVFITSYPAFAIDIEDGAKNFIYTQQKNITDHLDIKDKKEKFNVLYEEIDKTFATEDIYKFVVSRYAKLFTEQEKLQIIDFFKKLILVTYGVESKINVTSLTLQITKTTLEKLPDGTIKILLDGNIINNDKIDLIKVSFVVLYENENFRVFDIKVENLNMLITFRKMFNDMMQENFNDTKLLMQNIRKGINEIDQEIGGKPAVVEKKEVFILQ